jgi:hypothetical protein
MPFRLTPPKKPKTVENDVESGCLDFLRVRGYFPIRIHCGKFWSLDKKRILTGAKKGTPDWAFLHARYPGFLLETKRPGQEPTKEQRERMQEIVLGYHLEILVADDVDIVIAFVKRREKEWDAA